MSRWPEAAAPRARATVVIGVGAILLAASAQADPRHPGQGGRPGHPTGTVNWTRPNLPAAWPPFTPGPAAQAMHHEFREPSFGGPTYVLGGDGAFVFPGYPSVYGPYVGYPPYNPGLYVVQPEYPAYGPNTPSNYSVSYTQNNNNYGTVNVGEPAHDAAAAAAKVDSNASRHDGSPQEPGPSADASPASGESYTTAFADIERAWNTGDAALIRKHLPPSDAKVAVQMDRRYKYSLDPEDYARVTRDSLAKVDTTYFKFDRLHRADNDDITAYGMHIYRADASAASDVSTVPFDTGKPASVTAASDPVTIKAVYVSYTLRSHAGRWYITSVDSSSSPLVPDQGASSARH